MKFECGDLERALANPDLMPEAREHLKDCPSCRQEFRLWTDISSAARELHEDWETPGLWAQIREKLEAEPKPKPAVGRWQDWRVWAAVAAAIVIAVVAPLGTRNATFQTRRIWSNQPALCGQFRAKDRDVSYRRGSRRRGEDRSRPSENRLTSWLIWPRPCSKMAPPRVPSMRARSF